MDHLYPAGPASIPEQLTSPSSKYRSSAWLAMAGLASFVALYFALTFWFGWTAYHLLRDAINGGDKALLGFIAGFCAAFLTVFMAKAIFFVKHAFKIDDIEITAAQQPILFAFLNRLADEAGAPRPHRVFLSPRVNAAVFYDLSILNLFLPSKKNLEIGLGLVNVLSLGEIKAVLAHEFGHFAQRSMAVGRWVYIAQQIAGHIIAKRDALDKFLQGLSRFDLRVAWVGWLLSLIVWSIRSVMETVFQVVVLAQRALSREMEFQADLVAVSLTGSDAIVNALHRLNVADTAWDRAAQFAYSEARAGRLMPDVFAAQTMLIEKLRTIWNTPSFAEVPARPAHQPEAHRIFKNELAQPPRMWSTHPVNADREENAKRVYIDAPIDSRSAWELFKNPDAVREQMSKHIVREVKKDGGLEAVVLDASLQTLTEQYSRAYLQPQYRGAYLGRSVARCAAKAEHLYANPPPGDRIVAELTKLYPESLIADLDKLRQLEHEKASLQALYDGFLTAPGGIIRHGGKELQRRDLPDAIESLSKDLDAARERVHAHDRRCRGTHLAAAATLGNGWEEYLRGLAATLHYADHAEADLLDAQGAMHNVYSVVTADGKVSSSELTRLLKSCENLHEALRRVFEDANNIQLDRTLARRLKVEKWTDTLEEFKLQFPTHENISQWLQVVDGWVAAAGQALAALSLASLEQLLLTEAQVAKFVSSGMKPAEAARPTQLPSNYRVLMPGKERERQKRLGLWDRFHTADGLGATIARLAVAAAIIAAVVGVGEAVGTSSVTIHNGLARSVLVEVGEETAQVQPFANVELDIDQLDRFRVKASSDGKIIEDFEATADRGFTHYVYNVAGASPLVEWTAVYGAAREIPERRLGSPHWLTSNVDFLFTEPPEKISSKSGNGTRTVLTAVGGRSPLDVLPLLASDAERTDLINAHARWDSTDSKYGMYWLTLAAREQGNSILAERLRAQPDDIVLLRVEQDNATPAEKESVCARHRALDAGSNNPSLHYIAIRCMNASAEQDQAFIDAYARNPKNGWLALAAGYSHVQSAQWAKALPALQEARTQVPPIADYVALDIARIRRLSDPHPSFADLYADNSTIQMFEKVEAPTATTDRDPYTATFALLAVGKLDAASQAARQTDMRERILRLVAASDGASRSDIDAALTLPTEAGIDENTIWAAIALGLRERREVSKLEEIAKRDDPDAPTVMEFLHAIRAGDLSADRTKLRGTGVRLRGEAYSAAVVLLGDRCPAEWRTAAKRLLFAPERPYFL